MGDVAGWIIRAGIRCFSWLPLSAARTLAAAVATLSCWLRSPSARVTARNLQLCFPEWTEKKRHQVGLASMRHTAQVFAEMGMLWHWPLTRIMEHIDSVSGESLLDATPSRGGRLMLVPHFGNWEVVATYLGSKGLVALYDPPRFPSLDKPLRQARSRTGTTLWPLNRQGIKKILKALKGNGLIGMLPDQVPDREAGVYATFFDQAALTMTLAHRLGRVGDVTIVLGVARRTPTGFALEFSRLPEALKHPDPAVAVQSMNECIEKLVLTDVAQYQWEYKRFKSQPRGSGNLYRN